LPAAVVGRAEEVLAVLEKGEQGGALTRLADDLPLFSAARPAPREPRHDALAAALGEVQPDALTPREALDILYKLKALIAKP
jgi:DNA mismatch repair protein MutS